MLAVLRFPRLHLSKDDAKALRNRRAAAQGYPAPAGWAFFTVFSEQRGKELSCPVCESQPCGSSRNKRGDTEIRRMRSYLNADDE